MYSSRIQRRDFSWRMKKSVGNQVPPVPSTDELVLFARSRAGRIMLHQMGPAGVDVGLQPAIFGNSIVFFSPQGGTTIPAGLGSTSTTAQGGTGNAVSHPALATTNDYTVMTRTEFATGTTATGTAGFRSTLLPFTRGNAAGRGGWFFHCRFGMQAFSGTWQVLIGLSALAAILGGEPSAQANTAGLSHDSTDTNWQFLTRDASTPSKTDTGVAPAVNTPLDFSMFCPPQGTEITMRLANAMTGAILAGDTVKNANLPVNTAFLAVHFQLRSASGTTAKNIGMNRIYCEADY
jgi:hypothetical protein